MRKVLLCYPSLATHVCYRSQSFPRAQGRHDCTTPWGFARASPGVAGDVFGGCGLWLYPGAIKRCGYCSRILWNPAFFIILLGDLPVYKKLSTCKCTPGRLCPSSIVDSLALSIPFDCTRIFAYKLSRLLGEHAAKSFRAHFDGNAAAEVQLLYMTWLDYSCHHPKQTY